MRKAAQPAPHFTDRRGRYGGAIIPNYFNTVPCDAITIAHDGPDACPHVELFDLASGHTLRLKLLRHLACDEAAGISRHSCRGRLRSSAQAPPIFVTKVVRDAFAA